MALRGIKNIKLEYDCVVIGAGLGGLTCANRLAQSNHSVLLLEHHVQLGGLAAWFQRKHHIFDVALHGFPIGMMKTCRKYWTNEIAKKIVKLKGIRFDNPQFSFTTTYDRKSFTKLMTTEFGIDSSSVEQFFNYTRSMTFVDDTTMTTRELFENFFPGREDVWRLLMEPITYANGSTLEDPAVSYSIVFSNFMSNGVYTFKGGTDLIIKLMEEELIKNGVEIRTRATVEKITHNKDVITGVVVNGQHIAAKAVVSNANLKTTILDLLDDGLVSEEFRTKTEKVRINNSSCQVYIGIKEGEEIEYIGDLIFSSTADRFDALKMLDKNVTSRTFSIYYPWMRPGRERYAIVSSTNARFENWNELSEGQYKLAKNALAEDTLHCLEKYVPDIRSKVDHLEVATPCTFKRYTLHVNGSSFGTKFEGLPVSRDICSKAPGLFHTGSVAIIMSGWLGAANYGVIVANEVDRYLFGISEGQE
ncbi:MAG TPA: NAD(P)/FAD-dependent oxidoreductase [Nitrospinota bacterium]|nr:NAD(P)/FAD-dependent oxidoreductase [Nitrospinota bacterium]|tara:strand:- start:33386 stop:34810 length:1425 start_codon:yes stop_codon:yes gene_type:complete